MNIPAVLIANGSAVVLLAIILVSSRKTLHYGLVDNKLFIIMLLSEMFQCIGETATFLIDGQPGLGVLALILNTLVYMNNILFAFVWTLYADYKLFSDVGRLKRIYRFVAIPALIVWIGCIVNLFTPVFFSVSADNVYSRGDLFFIPFALTYLYLAYGVFMIYFFRDKVHKYLFLPAIVFMIPILIGSILQACFYGYSLIWIGAAIALASLYINVQNEVSYIDSMTGLFTRQYLIKFLAMQLRNPADGAIAGLMLDIDHFKEINDTYGHLTGDDAISDAGQLLRASLPPKGLAARYAGDEFVIIDLTGDDEALSETIRRLNANADKLNSSGKNKYKLHFSVGRSEYRSGDTTDSFLGRLDASMYEDKRRNSRLRRRSTDSE